MAETGDTPCASAYDLDWTEKYPFPYQHPTPIKEKWAMHGCYVTSTSTFRTGRVVGGPYRYRGPQLMLVSDELGTAWEVALNELRPAHPHEALAFRLTERRN